MSLGDVSLDLANLKCARRSGVHEILKRTNLGRKLYDPHFQWHDRHGWR